MTVTLTTPTGHPIRLGIAPDSSRRMLAFEDGRVYVRGTVIAVRETAKEIARAVDAERGLQP